MIPNQNFHIHSNLSGCASKNMSIERIITKAEKCYLTIIAVVDHIDRLSTRAQRGKELLRKYGEIKKIFIKQQSNIKVLLGCETSQISPNIFSVKDEVADKLDIVLVSCNHYHLKFVDKPFNTSPKGYADHYLTMLEGAVSWKYTDIIAHPFYLHKLKNIEHSEVLINYDRNRLKEILSMAVEKNIAFELCPRHFKYHLNFFQELLSYGREVKLKFSLGTDAHKLSQICYQYKDIEVLKLLDVQGDDLIN
jgi:HisJ family histidinol phosphate phosphatase